jgi:hypothetical protein
MKKLASLGILTYVAVLVLISTPLGVSAQQTIRNMYLATDDPTAVNIADIEEQLTNNTTDVNVSTIAGQAPLVGSENENLQLAATANGDGSEIVAEGYNSVMLEVLCSTCSGGTQINFEKSFDGTTWNAASFQLIVSPYTIASSTTTSGTTYWRAPVENNERFRARISAYSAGTVTVVARASFEAFQLDREFKEEDAAHTSGDKLLPIAARRIDTAASSAASSGDYATLNTDGLGRLWVRPGRPCDDDARIENVAVSTASSGNVELVALNSGDIIYVCGYDLVADGAVAVQFIYGTGSACATGETDMSGPMSFAANGGISRGVTGAAQFKTAVSNALCIENSTTGGIRGSVQYVRTAAP